MQQLREYYSDEGPERCGFILRDNSIVEVENLALNNNDGFEMSGKDILSYMYEAIGSWHTHPGSPSNLSMGDYDGFFNFKGMDHYIVGIDGIRRYYFKDDMLLCEEL